MEIIQIATLTCPYCDFKQPVGMPMNVSQRLYQCINCHVSLRPKPGDDCLFCSYSDVKCPPKQNEARRE